jgi:hypothetical protein
MATRNPVDQFGVNHIFVIVATFPVIKSVPLLILHTPLISFSFIGNILVRQKQIAVGETSFFLEGALQADEHGWSLKTQCLWEMVK